MLCTCRQRGMMLGVASVCGALAADTASSPSSDLVSTDAQGHTSPLSANPPAGDRPRLSIFEVTGSLPSRASRKLPFKPLFRSDDDTPRANYKCWLDFAMDRFTLDVDSESPSILSKVTVDGISVPSRTNLTEVHMRPGEKKIFSIGVKNMTKRIYTLIVERRIGTSTQLLELKPVTGTLAVPYNPGELQALFEVNQSFYRDFFEVEYVKADDGQQISCLAMSAKTVGDSAPTGGDLATHPHKFIPSLEHLHNETATKRFDPARGPVIHCSVPIDTWRRITVLLHIVSADGSAQRHVHLKVTRAGCPAGHFYNHGNCGEWCPSFHYEQRFNWRCGKCNEHCEFCEHWASCIRCQRDGEMQHYKLKDDGTCQQLRVHAYKVYYNLARYLAYSCAVLLVVYVLAASCWLCRYLCCPPEDDEANLEVSKQGNSMKRHKATKNQYLLPSHLTPRDAFPRQLRPAE